MTRTYLLTEQDTNYDEMGGKAGAFAILSQWHFRVPPWVVLTERVFRDSLPAHLLVEFESGKLEEVYLNDLSVHEAAMNEVAKYLESFENDRKFAVRSSARSEDGLKTSFAGQYESVLNVSKEDIPSAIVKVWRSAFSEHVNIYRGENHIEGAFEIPSVMIQAMVAADCAGVAFASDPITGDPKSTVVSAVYGLGSALVSGESDADVYSVKGGIITHKHIALKDKYQPGWGNESDWAAVKVEKQVQAVLSDVQIMEVSLLAEQVSWRFGRCMDIEWAYEGDVLYLLQARPITTTGSMDKTEGILNIWDNSNIAESYGGITSPLTFSFIRKAYEAAYRQMCLLLKVPEKRMTDNDLVFSQMLGLVHGRVYYNLISWYKVLALLPGYKFNRQFMEQMMGVKEGIPESVLDKERDASKREKFLDLIGLIGSGFGLVKSYFGLPKQTKAFYERLDEVLKEKDLKAMDLDDLSAYYRELEQKLLTKWDAPLINDFFAMIYYGLLKKMSEKWCMDESGTLHNDLLCGMGDIISAEPAKRIQSMAKRIAGNDAAVVILSEGSPTAVKHLLEQEKDLAEAIDSYIKTFGNRCLDELKLESDTLHEIPTPLYRSIGAFAKLIQSGKVLNERNELLIRQKAEEKAKHMLRGKQFKGVVYFKTAGAARRLVSGRENLRFERTRLFGRVREIVLHMGYLLASYGCIESQKDIFYLEIHEILGFVEGTATTRDLKGLVDVRKREAETNRSKPYCERFETRGAVGLVKTLKETVQPVELPEGNAIKGLGCCPGKVEGRVRVIKDPRGVTLKQGEILVAERTDPGWIMLFPAASGILVERGSLLSHAAIVAREMGIPAIVGLSGLTEWLEDGELVRFDGSTGQVIKCEMESV